MADDRGQRIWAHRYGPGAAGVVFHSRTPARALGVGLGFGQWYASIVAWVMLFVGALVAVLAAVMMILALLEARAAVRHVDPG